MIKAGTVQELIPFENAIDRDVYLAALRIVSMLDSVYGADRDVDNGDGGFVLVVENVKDVASIDQQYVKLNSNQHEAVDVVKCGNKAYINALFLCNNEFGINVLMPIDIAPVTLLGNLSRKVK